MSANPVHPATSSQAQATSSQAERTQRKQRPIAIVVTGEPIEAARLRVGAFPALIRGTLQTPSSDFVELDAQRGALEDLRPFEAVIVTGSPASVTERAPWILETEQRLREAVEAGSPILGICFGHQLLGQALGGKVARNPRGREIGTVRLERVAADALLDSEVDPFLVNMTHLDSIVELPDGAQVLARTALDPFAAVRFSSLVWGVQFHPEIDASTMRDYVEGRYAQIASEGLDGEGIRGAIADTPAGAAVIRRFLSEVANAGARG